MKQRQKHLNTWSIKRPEYEFHICGRIQKTMNHRSKAMQLSLLMHAALLVFICIAGRFTTQARPSPIFVDLSVLPTGPSLSAVSNTAPTKTDREKQATDPPQTPDPAPKKTRKNQTKALIHPAKEQRPPVYKKTQPKSEMLIRPDQEAAAINKKSTNLQDLSRERSDTAHHPIIQATKKTRDVSGPATDAASAIGANTPAHLSVAAPAPGSGPGKKGGGTKKTQYNLEYIRDIIMKNLKFPASARKLGLTGRVMVSFTLRSDGNVRDIAIVSGSGYEILDGNVIDTIRRIARFPKPPLQAQIVLPIDYHMK